jgi:HSP20 family protein
MADTKVEVKTDAPKTPAPMRPAAPDLWQSFYADTDRMFDRFLRGFGMPSLRRMFDAAPTAWRGGLDVATPAIDVAEDDKALHLTAELPGMSEKDVDVTVANDTITIKGEKREEKETKEKNYYLSERRFGSFQRTFPLPDSVDRDKIVATFEKGVLTLTLPKTTVAAAQQKKIEIKTK